MQKNRSLPTDTILPHVVYRDVAEAVAWLTKTFGFIEHYRYGDPAEPLSGAQMHLRSAWIMLHRARPGSSSPAQLGSATQSLTVFVEDVESHFQRTKAAGAKILEGLTKPSMANSNTPQRISTATIGSSPGTRET
jgi:uncharacterized glyoxalase superfamily protein PhnB